MRRLVLFPAHRTGWAVAWLLAAAGCAGTADNAAMESTPASAATAPIAGASTGGQGAFFYQYVGRGQNAVRTGVTDDGLTIRSQGVAVATWEVTPSTIQVYGDPVFSRLQDGRWAMAAGTGRDDPRGRGALLYHESDCPQVDEAAVIAINPASGPACTSSDTLVGGKVSEIFAAEGGSYMFFMNGAEIYLARLSDGRRRTTELSSICLLRTRPASLAGLGFGEAARVIDTQAAGGLLLSDTAVARRADGTWVLFVKGIRNGTCSGPGLCELCNRGIYRATSTDLLDWSTLTEVVIGASVPEATATLDGRVWLYFQDFSDACAANDLDVAARAPISAVYELASGGFSSRTRVSFPDEPFQADASIHYATNANPILLPDQAARDALAACLRR